MTSAIITLSDFRQITKFCSRHFTAIILFLLFLNPELIYFQNVTCEVIFIRKYNQQLTCEQRTWNCLAEVEASIICSSLHHITMLSNSYGWFMKTEHESSVIQNLNKTCHKPWFGIFDKCFKFVQLNHTITDTSGLIPFCGNSLKDT